MSAETECTSRKRRIPAAIARVAAILSGAAGLVLLVGPATANISIDGVPLHHAAIGGGLMALAGVILAVGCRRSDAVLQPIPAEKVRAIAEERRKEARQIIAGAARRSTDLPQA